jgi:hypothetical protein
METKCRIHLIYINMYIYIYIYVCVYVYMYIAVWTLSSKPSKKLKTAIRSDLEQKVGELNQITFVL